MQILRLSKNNIIVQAYCSLCGKETAFEKEKITDLFRCTACRHAVKDFSKFLGQKISRR